VVALFTGAGHPDLCCETQRKLQPTGEIRNPCLDAPTGPPLAAVPGQAGRAAAEFGSIISDDSSTASNCAAGTVLSSLSRLSGHAASSVPLKNQLLPLSARMSP
jgi:hypothetical protein